MAAEAEAGAADGAGTESSADRPELRAAAPAAGRAASSLAVLLVPSLLLAAGALLLALHERPRLSAYRQKIFQLLFARNEPDGALLLLALVLLAPLVAWLLADGGRRARPTATARWLALPARLSSRRIVIAVAVGATLALAAGAVLVYQARPLAMDEHAPLFQSRVFAAGELRGRVPPDLLPRVVPARLLFPFFATDPAAGTIVSTYWPGFALLLTPFSLLGASWLLNPLLAGAALLLFALLARRWTGEPAAAGWALLFALASPAFTINAISFYPLTAHLALNLLWMALLVETKRDAESSPTLTAAPLDIGATLTNRPQRLLGAGVVGSLALVLNNPVPHAIFALPWLAALLRRRGWRTTAWLALGYFPLVLVLGAGWLPVRQTIRDPSAAAASADATNSALALAADMVARAFVLPSAPLLYTRLQALVEAPHLGGTVPSRAGATRLARRAARLAAAPPRRLGARDPPALLLHPLRSGARLGLPLLPSRLVGAAAARRRRPGRAARRSLARAGARRGAARHSRRERPARGAGGLLRRRASRAAAADPGRRTPPLLPVDRRRLLPRRPAAERTLPARPGRLPRERRGRARRQLVTRRFPRATLVSRRADASVWRLPDPISFPAPAPR